MPVDDEIDVRGRVVQQPLAEINEHRGAGVALIDGEPQRAFADTAEIMCTECRAPVLRTSGVCPTGAQVVPAW